MKASVYPDDNICSLYAHHEVFYIHCHSHGPIHAQLSISRPPQRTPADDLRAPSHQHSAHLRSPIRLRKPSYNISSPKFPTSLLAVNKLIHSEALPFFLTALRLNPAEIALACQLCDFAGEIEGIECLALVVRLLQDALELLWTAPLTSHTQLFVSHLL